MGMPTAISAILLSITFLATRDVVSQNTDSIRIPSSGDSCNVINLNIGREDDTGGQSRGPQGTPGKRGNVGLPGLKGDKGVKGEVGRPGDTPAINVAEIISSVAKAQAAKSCKELMDDHGLSESGFYQMRMNGTNHATYIYCDFELRNVATCEELKELLGDDMKSGFYHFHRGDNFTRCFATADVLLLPDDCRDAAPENAKTTLPQGGVFDIYSELLARKFEVTCDLQTDGGGWTVFQKRMDGSVDFYRDWNDYVNGFGNKGGEFWLGSENIYQLTKNGDYELRVDLEDWSGNTAYAIYGVFSISSAEDNYRLNVGQYSGTAGDSLAYNNNEQFTTKDADHDEHNRMNCAVFRKGAWWYKECSFCNLNGIYHKGSGTGANGVTWYHWKNSRFYLKTTEMKFRMKE